MGPGVAWQSWGRLANCFLGGQIDCPKYVLYICCFWPGWGRLYFTCSLGGFQDYFDIFLPDEQEVEGMEVVALPGSGGDDTLMAIETSR